MTQTEVFGQKSKLSSQQTHYVPAIKSSMTSVGDSCQYFYHLYFPATGNKAVPHICYRITLCKNTALTARI